MKQAVFALSVLFAGCASGGPEAQGYSYYVEALAVPDFIEGEINSGTEYYISLRSQCGNNSVLCELYDRVIADSYISELHAFGRTTSAAAAAMSEEDFKNAVDSIKEDNDDWLERTVMANGWFTIDKFGAEADLGAFLLVQHTQDVELQNSMLEFLEPLVLAGQSDPKNFALLYDRVRTRSGEPQRYGSQGSCNDAGIWVPFATADHPNVNARRKDMGLPSIESYAARMTSKYC